MTQKDFEFKFLVKATTKSKKSMSQIEKKGFYIFGSSNDNAFNQRNRAISFSINASAIAYNIDKLKKITCATPNK